MTDIPKLSDIEYQPLVDISRQFTLDTGLKCDYACFVIWNGALQRQEEILADLHRNFELLADYEVHWSKEFYRQNIDRLYERPMRGGAFVGWDKKIGPPPFRFLIVRDAHPKYTWKRNVSGLIEPSNENVVEAKYRYRDLFLTKYQVHSSNNIEEFLSQSVLILGPEYLHAALTTPVLKREVLHKDLEGSGGWENWRKLFEVLNIGSRYLVQRNFEGLPDHLADEDIDFLCDNFQKLASLCGLRQNKPAQPYKGSVLIDGTDISVDIRFIGDKYFPVAWQVDMLHRRQFQSGIFVPAPDDLFFSVLFHCKVQKKQVKSNYVAEISALAKELRFDWFDEVDLEDDAACGEILNGYMRARKYYYELPLDRGVKQNMAVIGRLPSAPAGVRMGSLREKVMLAIRHPRKARKVVLSNVKGLARKLLGR